MTKPASVDEYIAGFSKNIQTVLQQIRATVKKAVPGATEAITYAMPTFVLDGRNLAHFAAFKNHIGFYPAPTGIESFEKELSRYKTGRGSVQFPLDRPMPVALITKIVKFNAGRNAERAAKKKK